MSDEFAKAYDQATVSTGVAADTHSKKRKEKEKGKNMTSGSSVKTQNTVSFR